NTCGCSTSSSTSSISPDCRLVTSSRWRASASRYAIEPSRRTLSMRDACVAWRAPAGRLMRVAPRLDHVRIPVLERPFDERHEVIGDRAVDDPVIVAERQVPHRPYRDRIVDHDGPLLPVADAE